MAEIIRVISDDSDFVHIKSITGNYATLCGMTTDDEECHGREGPLQARTKVTCPMCFDIWATCLPFKKPDFRISA